MVPSSAQPSLNPNGEEGLDSSTIRILLYTYIDIAITRSHRERERERERGGTSIFLSPTAFRCLFDRTKGFNQTSFVMIRIAACRLCTLI